MKRIFLLLTIWVTFFFSCKNNEKQPPAVNTPVVSADSFLLTDSTWGPITASTTFEGLERIYGENNLKDVRECDLECQDSIDVTKVFPGQKNEITIQWIDTAYHKKIRMIQSFNEQPDWHSAEGIKIGSGLKELLKVNGARVSFYGFGWDYAGTVDSYNGGKLDKSTIAYRLDLDGEPFEGDNTLYGDIGLDTDMPIVQKVMDNIRVSWITLSFYKEE